MENKILICVGTSGIAAGAKEVQSNFKTALAKHALDKKYKVIAVGDRGLFRDVLVDIVTPNQRITYEYVKPSDVDQIVEEHLVGGKIVKKLQTGEDYQQF